jgi:glycosyltransferase involved in cell wall biosynthesis
MDRDAARAEREPASPQFTVVVPSIGRDPGLPELLAALGAQTLPRESFDIVVALSGGEPSRRVRESGARSGARLVVLGATRGPGASRNAAARAARGEFLAFTEDDCVPAVDWLACAAARLATDPALDVLAGRTIKPGGRAAHRQRQDSPLYLPTNLFVRRAWFERVGGYCEEFFDGERGIYFREDSDLGFTLEEAGARVARLEDAVVTHPEEHPRPGDALRWAARYVMDPLLARRHPRLFRERIEVHRVGPLTVRRPVVNAARIVVVGLVVAVTATLLGRPRVAVVAAGVALGGWCVMWAKWRFRPAFLGPALVVPFVLVWALLRGALRARRLGAAPVASAVRARR